MKCWAFHVRPTLPPSKRPITYWPFVGIPTKISTIWMRQSFDFKPFNDLTLFYRMLINEPSKCVVSSICQLIALNNIFVLISIRYDLDRKPTAAHRNNRTTFKPKTANKPKKSTTDFVSEFRGEKELREEILRAIKKKKEQTLWTCKNPKTI